MGLKLELFLIVFVTVVLSVALTIKVSNKDVDKSIPTKELEFTDTTFTEVDTNKTIGVSYGTHGIRDNTVLTIQNFRYHNDSIKNLRAKTAIYKGDKIYLDLDVVLHQEEGSSYYTDHAIYDKKLEILDITSPFKAVKEKNIMYGDTLRYWMKTKEVFATNVDAVVYTKEK
jgi:hypothetical protein